MSFFNTNNTTNNNTTTTTTTTTGFNFTPAAGTANTAPAVAPVAPVNPLTAANTTAPPTNNVAPPSFNNTATKKKEKEEVENKQPATLKQILERSKLTNSKILSQELPSFERGLDQIDLQSKKLSAMTASNDEGVNIRAHYFLAQGGVNTQVLIKELGTIHLGELERERQPVQDTDIEEYLEQQNTETVIKIVQDERQEILDATNDLFKRDIDAYWNDLLYNSLNLSNIKETTLILSKAKLDLSRIASAGTN